MKYYLRNISRNSPMRTIVFVLIGLFLWVMSFIQAPVVLDALWSLSLVLLITVLITHYASKAGWTNLPSAFVASTVWLLLSVLSVWTLCWQVHMVVLMYVISMLILNRVHIQDEAKQQAYALCLLMCVLSPHWIATLALIIYLVVHLLVRSRFSWRVLVAVLLAVATYVLYAAIVRYLGWFERLWLDNLPRLAWQYWAMGMGAYLLVWFVTYIPLARHSVSSGVLYLVGVLAAIAMGVWRVLEWL